MWDLLPKFQVPSTMVLLASIVLLAATYLVHRWLRVRRYWAERGVPHEPPHPIMGSLTFLQRRNVFEWLQEQYPKFKPAPYFGAWLFWRPALFIMSPEIARNVLVKDADVFKNRLASCGKSDPIGALNMFTVNDPLWSVVRKRTTSMFTSSKLKALHTLKNTKAQDLMQRLKADIAANKFIDLRETFSCYTTDVIGAAAFGVAGDATLTGESPMRTVTKGFMKFNWWRGLAWSSIFFLPELTDVFGFSFFPKESIEYFRRVYAQVYKERTAAGAPERGRDLMDSLIKMKKDAIAENEDSITDDVLIAQAAIFLQGGFDTTAMALSYLTYELAFNPTVQQRLYEEVLAIKKEKGITYESLQDMTYLNCCIKEDLRKYAALGWLDRVSSHEYKVDDKLTIAAGTSVYVNSAGMHYDPEYFPDPRAFNPDRWLPENEGSIKPFTYMPFGEGPRNCIGLRFGLSSMRYALAYLVLTFQLSPQPGALAPRELRAEPRSMLHAADQPLSVRFLDRKTGY